MAREKNRRVRRRYIIRINGGQNHLFFEHSMVLGGNTIGLCFGERTCDLTKVFNTKFFMASALGEFLIQHNPTRCWTSLSYQPFS